MYFRAKNTSINNHCRILKTQHSFNKLVWATTCKEIKQGFNCINPSLNFRTIVMLFLLKLLPSPRLGWPSTGFLHVRSVCAASKSVGIG